MQEISPRSPETTQQPTGTSRLMPVETDDRRLAAELTRTTLMLLLAGILILVLLPAALGASGA